MCAHPSCVSDDVVTYEQLKDMMSTGSVQLFDVREPDELEAGFIPGATNIPCKSPAHKDLHKHTHRHDELRCFWSCSGRCGAGPQTEPRSV